MRNLALRLLQALLWFASLSHLIIGAGIMLSSSFQHEVALLYGAEVDWSPQFTYILRPLGAFMFVWGILLAAAAIDPPRHRLIAFGLCGVLLIRVLQRMVLHQDVQDAFSISAAKNAGMALFFLVEAILIALLMYRVRRTAVSSFPSESG